MQSLSDKHSDNIAELDHAQSRAQAQAAAQRTAIHERHAGVVREARGEICEAEVARAQRKRVEAVEIERRNIKEAAAAAVMYLEDQYVHTL